MVILTAYKINLCDTLAPGFACSLAKKEVGPRETFYCSMQCYHTLRLPCGT